MQRFETLNGVHQWHPLDPPILRQIKEITSGSVSFIPGTTAGNLECLQLNGTA